MNDLVKFFIKIIVNHYISNNYPNYKSFHDLFLQNFAHYLEFLIIKEYIDMATDNDYANVNNIIEDSYYL